MIVWGRVKDIPLVPSRTLQRFITGGCQFGQFTPEFEFCCCRGGGFIFLNKRHSGPPVVVVVVGLKHVPCVNITESYSGKQKAPPINFNTNWLPNSFNLRGVGDVVSSSWRQEERGRKGIRRRRTVAWIRWWIFQFGYGIPVKWTIKLEQLSFPSFSSAAAIHPAEEAVSGCDSVEGERTRIIWPVEESFKELIERREEEGKRGRRIMAAYPTAAADEEEGMRRRENGW